MKYIISLLIGFVLTWSTCIPLIAQTDLEEDTFTLKILDTLPSDSILYNNPDSSGIIGNRSRSEVIYDTTKSLITEPEVPIGEIETVINYNAQDSIFFDLKSSNLTLFGDSHIDYGEIELDSDKTQISMTDRILTSTYSLDSTGKKHGKPIFTEKGTVYDCLLYTSPSPRDS